MSYQVKDKTLQQTKALSNGAGNTSIDGFDLGTSANADFLSGMELLIEAPALLTAELPDAQTMIYSVEHDTDPAFGSATVVATSVLVQTGAGGAGAAAASARFRLPTNVKRYVRVKATKGGSGNASGKSMTVSCCF